MTDAQPPPLRPRKGFKSALIEFLIVALIGVARPARASSSCIPPQAAPTSRKRSAAAVGPSTIYNLPSIVTNLGAPQDTWIRLEGSIVFDPKSSASSRSRRRQDWRG